jgi:hypothetical protein
MVMLRASHVVLPVSEPLALLDATLLFLIQVLLARHPDLFVPPESDAPQRRAPNVRAAQLILDAVREVHHAIELYHAASPDTLRAGCDDDIPF